MLRNLVITTARRNGVYAASFTPASSSKLFSTVAADTAESAEKALVKVDINADDRIATLTLNRAPVNSLSLEMNEAISAAIKEVESNRKVQGMVLSSSNPTTLSAGLDLKELYNPNPERLTKFWRSFQQVFLDLYGSRLATVGAVGGNAPAAGCMLALSCDYRVMQGSTGDGPAPLIGLNEAKFGIAAPPFLGQLMLRTIGHRQGELALSLGTLFTPEQALKVGLVDELTDGGQVLARSQEVAKQWTKIPPHARVASKTLARGEFLQDLIRNRDEDVEQFKNFVMNDMVQANLGAYLKSLSGKK